jgi:hypothetical protein
VCPSLPPGENDWWEDRQPYCSCLSEKIALPSLRLWKPWKTASGLRTVPTACAHPLFSLWLSPYTEKVFIFCSEDVQLP